MNRSLGACCVALGVLAAIPAAHAAEGMGFRLSTPYAPDGATLPRSGLQLNVGSLPGIATPMAEVARELGGPPDRGSFGYHGTGRLDRPDPATGGGATPLGLYRPNAGASLDYQIDRWTLSSSLRQGLAGGPRGTSFDVGASYGFALAPRHQLALAGSFGLGTHEIVRSLAEAPVGLGLRPSGIGFRDVGAGLSLAYTYDRTWFVHTAVGYSRLLSDPGDSGGYERDVTSFGAYFGYRF